MSPIEREARAKEILHSLGILPSADRWWDKWEGVWQVIGLAVATERNLIVMVENPEQRAEAAHQVVAAMFSTLMGLAEAVS